MKNHRYALVEADSIEVITLVDNFSDVLLPGNDVIIRPPLEKSGVIPKDTLLAEHGLSLLVHVRANGRTCSVIIDSGYTNIAVPHNLDYLGLSLEEIKAVVLSHGHMDHVGALKEILHLCKPGTKLILHPDVFLPRSVQRPSNEVVLFPDFPSRDELMEWGADVVENCTPLLLGDGSILVTGEIPRVTGFEKGMVGSKIRQSSTYELDSFKDDQSLVVNLAGKGLVVITGCAHSGVINSVLYAMEITGERTIHAILGGFHLSGDLMEPNIEPTIEEMKKISPKVISPMHCTGFKAISRFATEFSEAFVLNSVGSRIVL